MFRHIAITLGLGLAAATAAVAQDAPQAAPDPAALDQAATYEAARNQLGLLKFCQTQGFSGTEAVSVQEKMVGLLPQGDEIAGATAEQKGAEGTVAVAGTEITLEKAATQQGSSVEEQCRQIEAAVNEVGKQLPAG